MTRFRLSPPRSNGPPWAPVALAWAPVGPQREKHKEFEKKKLSAAEPVALAWAPVGPRGPPKEKTKTAGTKTARTKTARTKTARTKTARTKQLEQNTARTKTAKAKQLEQKNMLFGVLTPVS